jgi:hypothetical protein
MNSGSEPVGGMIGGRMARFERGFGNFFQTRSRGEFTKTWPLWPLWPPVRACARAADRLA